MINWPAIAQLRDYPSPREMFTDFYHRRGLSQAQIAEIMHCERSAIQDALKKYNVPTKSKGRKCRLDTYLESHDIQTSRYGIRALCQMIGYKNIRDMKYALRSRGLSWHKGERINSRPSKNSPCTHPRPVV